MSASPALPDRAALLLDVDGTLLDIAPRPDLVVVPPDLVTVLRALRIRLNGALAVITGRPVEQVDALLGDAPFAVAGEHGGAIRHAPGEPIRRPELPAPPPAWLDAAGRIAAAHPGVMLEPKLRGFVLHYRAAPEAGDALQIALATLIAPDRDRFQLMPARMAWEVRPQGADKGVAVRQLMAEPPFAGRVPVFVGDDVTDEDGIAAAAALGGRGLFVPEVFGDAVGVRAWLAALTQ
jgi:trehalose 6-phosphate phosphatase